MNYKLLQKAISIAVEAHKNQTREDGSPYILHPIRVMMKMKTISEMIVAILHDVIEDTDITLEDLQKQGFSYDAVQTIWRLTKNKDEKYENYLGSISLNRVAIQVKMADIQDNLNILELQKIDDYRLKRIKKYYWGYKFLEEKSNQWRM